jgi:hypothetical protein
LTFANFPQKATGRAKKLQNSAISVWFFAEKRATSPLFGGFLALETRISSLTGIFNALQATAGQSSRKREKRREFSS